MSLSTTKSIADLQAEAGKPTLRRALGPFNLTALGIGSVIGTGIFVLTGTAASQNAGPALVALDGHCGRRLRAGGTVLRRAGLDDPGRRERVYLCLRHLGRVRRLDHRLGPDPRVCAQRLDGRRGMVGILRQPSPRPGTRPAARAHRGAGSLYGDGRRDHGPRRVQSAGGGDRPPGDGAPGRRHPAERQREHRARRDQDGGADRLRRSRGRLRPAREPRPLRAAQPRRVRPLRLERRPARRRR